MKTDLTKMVEEWHGRRMPDVDLHFILKAMAKQIEANREEVEKLKNRIIETFVKEE